MWGSEPSKNNSQSKNEAADQAGIFIGVAFVAGIGILFTVKYLPIVLLGSLIGFLTYTARFQLQPMKVIRHALFTLAFFALLYLILIGVPLESKERWDGVLFQFPKFGDFCVFVVRQWNSFVSEWFFGFFKKWQVRRLTPVLVSQYAWMSYEFGIALSFLFFILGLNDFVVEAPVK